jgi:hypothetical protein
MSYSFGLYFKQCESFEEGFETALAAKKLLVENMRDYINDNVCGCPTINFDKSNPMADRYWLNSLFSMKFIFFRKYNILGLSGFDYPNVVELLFNGHIHFQNSGDQDYAFTEWPDAVELFKRTKEQLLEEHGEETSAIRQSFYDCIMLKLDLGRYIDRRETPDLEIFQLNAVEHDFLASNMNVVLKRAIHDKIEEEVQDFAEMVAPQLHITEEVLSSGKIKYKDKEYSFDNLEGEDKALEIAKAIIRTNFKNSGKMEDW